MKRLVFGTIKDNLLTTKKDEIDPVLMAIGLHSGQVKSNFEDLVQLITNYDEQINGVLQQHQQDFLYAYQLHMVKIEKELSFLKTKAAEQEVKLIQDQKIVSLEQQLRWHQVEFQSLIDQRYKNDEIIEKAKDACKTLEQTTKELRENVKAQ